MDHPRVVMIITLNLNKQYYINVFLRLASWLKMTLYLTFFRTEPDITGYSCEVYIRNGWIPDFTVCWTRCNARCIAFNQRKSNNDYYVFACQGVPKINAGKV